LVRFHQKQEPILSETKIHAVDLKVHALVLSGEGCFAAKARIEDSCHYLKISTKMTLAIFKQIIPNIYK